jgi:DNA replication and repair protein RecF
VRVSGVRLRDFRGYHDAKASLGDGVTVVWGPNGAGKTNLLEAVYFGCTGRSCRTTNEREVVRFGAGATRVVIDAGDDDGTHELSVGFAPGQPKRMRADGATVERLVDVDARPLVSVFLPDRLELIKGAPALRRAHLDQFVAALWPARVATRRAYAQALAQRNALIGRIRSGTGSRSSLPSWDQRLAELGVALMNDRAGAVERLGSDLERGFTGHGPHRDDLVAQREAHDLRSYGSQGQQRLALLALLLAEREVIAAARRWPPLMLLDDVMSELDRDRRDALVELLRSGGGQSVITTTDLEHVPGAGDDAIWRIEVVDGRIVQAVAA